MLEDVIQKDTTWLLLCTALVLLMQAGFICLESGLVRAKNSVSVAIKNVVDFCLASLVFWAVGFGLMFGASWSGFVGTSGFLFGEVTQPWLTSFFLFQLLFCGTATTIVGGAVAERMRFAGYLFVALLIAALVYPVIGHWIWAKEATGGWLHHLGFIDFAGATVVHSTAGWVALAAVMIIGPRLGRFQPDPISIHGHNLPMAALGTFLLWFGWYGFNGGNVLQLNAQVPLIFVNTTLAGAAGGVASVVLTWQRFGRPIVPLVLNGVIAGLVGITASANIMSPVAALFIGAVAGIICVLTTQLLEWWRIDDVIGAVPTHAAAGVWGTLAVALFADPAAWGTGLGRWEQLGVQAIGIGSCFAWAFGIGGTGLWLVNRWFPLRVTAQEEEIGLNMAEHGASTALLDLVGEMERHRQRGDFFMPVEVEPHTEVGQIAEEYNRVLARVVTDTQKRDVALTTLQVETNYVETLQKVAIAANEGDRLEDALHTTLNIVCRITKWPVGHAYVRLNSKDEILQSTRLWHLDDPEKFAVFRQVTEQMAFPSGRGLPGRVLATGHPAWISDVTQDSNFPQGRIAKEIGVKGAFAFPVILGETVMAVLEFYSEQAEEPNERLLEIMEAIGTQLGRLIERKQGADVLTEINAKLESKNAELERFAYTVSHDLHSPLVTIQGFLGLAEQDARTGNMTQLDADLQRVRGAAIHMHQLLEELLELSRVGAIVNPSEDVAMSEVVVEAMEHVAGIIADRKVQVDIVSKWPVVLGDRVRLIEVVQNLVDNAAKYMGAQEEPRIEIGARQEGEAIVMYVRDNGVGIEPQYHHKVFGLFEQLDAQTKGTGIGLAIVKRIIEVQGGRIWVESEGQGRGSTFCFTLPRGERGGLGHGAQG